LERAREIKNMGLFDQIKQLKQMKDLQDKISKEKETIEKEGIKVTVNGKMEIEEIILNPSLDLNTQQRFVKEAINEAMHKVQMTAAQQLMQMRGE
jgi:DNA-binding protein YbaB